MKPTEHQRKCVCQLLNLLNFTSAVIKVLYLPFMLYNLLKKNLPTIKVSVFFCLVSHSDETFFTDSTETRLDSQKINHQ